MTKKLRTAIVLGALALGSLSMTSVKAYASDQGHGHGQGRDIDHVLLISVDGLHALDYLNCSAGIASVNGRNLRSSRYPRG